MMNSPPLGFLAVMFGSVACSGFPALQTQPDGSDGTTNNPGGTGGDTGFYYTTTGGPPAPNPLTDSTNQRCLLLYGGTDRAKSRDLGFPFKQEARTMQGWVRTNWDGEQVAMSYGKGSVRQGFTLGVVDGVVFADANGDDRLTSTQRIDDDEWHHVAASYDGTFMAIVIDGELDGFGRVDVRTESGGFNIGNLPEASPERHPWIGWIDDVKVFDFARSPDDIDADLDGEKVDDKELLRWYDFEVVGDVSGPNIVIEDLSGNGEDAETAGLDDHPEFPFCR